MRGSGAGGRKREGGIGPTAGLEMRSMSVDLKQAQQSAHRANIERYRRLLECHLSDHEREFVERRIAEEGQALQQIAGENALDTAVG